LHSTDLRFPKIEINPVDANLTSSIGLEFEKVIKASIRRMHWFIIMSFKIKIQVTILFL
jgi:hypothetical protein